MWAFSGHLRAGVRHTGNASPLIWALALVGGDMGFGFGAHVSRGWVFLRLWITENWISRKFNIHMYANIFDCVEAPDKHIRLYTCT